MAGTSGSYSPASVAAPQPLLSYLWDVPTQRRCRGDELVEPVRRDPLDGIWARAMPYVVPVQPLL